MFETICLRFCYFYFQELPIVNGSRISEAWKSPPVKPLLKFTFFNITNPTAFLNPNVKAKPKLQEVGPYVYE